jgi:thioredoxin-like negative regulator of GroEL
VVKVNTREERELSKRLGVSATPTIIALEEGRIVAAMAGTQSERRLKKLFRESRRRAAQPQA